MANRNERAAWVAQQKWQQRKTPLELGRYHAQIGRLRSSNPFSDCFSQSREDWFAGFDAVRNAARKALADDYDKKHG
jgi:hypothetical protein